MKHKDVEPKQLLKCATPVARPELVLFDMDGVLFDTMPLHARSWKETMDAYGIEAKREEFFLYEGMKGRDTIEQLYERAFGELPSSTLRDEIYEHKCSLFNTLASDAPITTIPGAEAFMDLLQEQYGTAMGVVTGSTIHNAFPRIKAHYSSYFTPESITTADHVDKGKPHPEPYLRGMAHFGVSPDQTLVIENAPLGVRSAAEAGAFTVALTTGPIPEGHLRREGANLVFPNFRALTIWWQHHYRL